MAGTSIIKIRLLPLFALTLIATMFSGCNIIQVKTQETVKAQENAELQIAISIPVCAKESLPQYPDVHIT